MIDYLRAATTALNWANADDRICIEGHLREAADRLETDVRWEKSAITRTQYLVQLERMYQRLAVLDLARARDIRQSLNDNRLRTYGVMAIENMADAIDNIATTDAAMTSMLVAAAKDIATDALPKGLERVFITGPHSALAAMIPTIAEMSVEAGVDLRAGLLEVCSMARRIPVSQKVDAEEIEAQVFRDGIKLLRRHLGLNDGHDRSEIRD